MRRNTYALLIAGDEERFVGNIVEFQSYLLNEASFNPDTICSFFADKDRGHISGIRGNFFKETPKSSFSEKIKCLFQRTRTKKHDYHVLEVVRAFLQEAKANTPHEPAVILYSGHSGIGTFSPSSQGQDLEVSYEDLAQVGGHEAGFLFINDCCHSGSVIPIFRKPGILPEKRAVITSAASDELSYGQSFHRTLLKSLRQRKPYLREKIGTHEVTGEVRFRPFPNQSPEEDLIIDFGYTEHITYQNPIIEGKIQHPQRYGLDLDHLLFPE